MLWSQNYAELDKRGQNILIMILTIAKWSSPLLLTLLCQFTVNPKKFNMNGHCWQLNWWMVCVLVWYTIQFFIANFEVILRLGDMRPVESGAHFKVTILKSQIQQPTQTTQDNNWKPWKKIYLMIVAKFYNCRLYGKRYKGGNNNKSSGKLIHCFSVSPLLHSGSTKINSNSTLSFFIKRKSGKSWRITF